MLNILQNMHARMHAHAEFSVFMMYVYLNGMPDTRETFTHVHILKCFYNDHADIRQRLS